MRFSKKLFAKILLLTSATLVLENIVSAQTQAQSTEKLTDLFNNAVFHNTIDETLKKRTIVAAPDESPRKPEPPPIPAPLAPKKAGKPDEIERAYLDAYAILAEENRCSNFLGGPYSISALNELVKHLKPTYLQPSIAVKMSGPVTTYQSNLTGAAFRIFNKTEINLDGAFFRTNSISNPRVPFIGNFPPNTRGARVAVLLHELGHLVLGPDKRYVLPDDGGDPFLSRDNTFRILDVCEKSINEILKDEH